MQNFQIVRMRSVTDLLTSELLISRLYNLLLKYPPVAKTPDWWKLRICKFWIKRQRGGEGLATTLGRKKGQSMIYITSPYNLRRRGWMISWRGGDVTRIRSRRITAEHESTLNYHSQARSHFELTQLNTKSQWKLSCLLWGKMRDKWKYEMGQYSRINESF